MGVMARHTESEGLVSALGPVIVDDCQRLLSELPDNRFDLIKASGPYDGQSKYGGLPAQLIRSRPAAQVGHQL